MPDIDDWFGALKIGAGDSDSEDDVPSVPVGTARPSSSTQRLLEALAGGMQIQEAVKAVAKVTSTATPASPRQATQIGETQVVLAGVGSIDGCFPAGTSTTDDGGRKSDVHTTCSAPLATAASQSLDAASFGEGLCGAPLVDVPATASQTAKRRKTFHTAADGQLVDTASGEPIVSRKMTVMQPSCAIAAAEAVASAAVVSISHTASQLRQLLPLSHYMHVGDNADKSAQVLSHRVDICLASFNLGIAVDVKDIAKKLPNVEMCVYFKGAAHVRSLKHPRWFAAIFPTGVVHVATNYDGDDARVAAKRVARLLQQRYNERAMFRSYTVFQVMSIGQLAFRVDIEEFSIAAAATFAAAENGRGGAQGEADASSGPSRSYPEVRLLTYKAYASKPYADVQVELAEGASKFDLRVYESGMIRSWTARSSKEALSAMKALVPRLSQHHAWW